jgi:hypothetical protein
MSKKNKTEVATPKQKTYTVDMTALTEQMLTDDVSNWIISEGATAILNGKTPGRNMIAFLEHMKIIK